MDGATDGFTGWAPEMPGASACCLTEALPTAPTPTLPLLVALALLAGLMLAWAPPSPVGLVPRADRWRPPGRPRFSLFHAYLT